MLLILPRLMYRSHVQTYWYMKTGKQHTLTLFMNSNWMPTESIDHSPNVQLHWANLIFKGLNWILIWCVEGGREKKVGLLYSKQMRNVDLMRCSHDSFSGGFSTISLSFLILRHWETVMSKGYMLICLWLYDLLPFPLFRWVWICRTNEDGVTLYN